MHKKQIPKGKKLRLFALTDIITTEVTDFIISFKKEIMRDKICLTFLISDTTINFFFSQKTDKNEIQFTDVINENFHNAFCFNGMPDNGKYDCIDISITFGKGNAILVYEHSKDDEEYILMPIEDVEKLKQLVKQKL